MLKKIVLLAAMAISLATTVSTLSASEVLPLPSCLPCEDGL